jgi:hypothetical protein
VKETIRSLGIGVSWGGTRSLIAPMSVEKDRTVTPWTEKGTLVRISIGHPDVPALTALAHLGRTDAAGRIGAVRMACVANTCSRRNPIAAA